MFSSIGFWCFGVNFLPQFLHSRILRIPIVLVLRTPFFWLRLLPHAGQIGGLPLAINITSTGRKRDLIFKAIDLRNEQTVRFECSRWKAFLRSHFQCLHSNATVPKVPSEFYSTHKLLGYSICGVNTLIVVSISRYVYFIIFNIEEIKIRKQLPPKSDNTKQTQTYIFF